MNCQCHPLLGGCQALATLKSVNASRRVPPPLSQGCELAFSPIQDHGCSHPAPTPSYCPSSTIKTRNRTQPTVTKAKCKRQTKPPSGDGWKYQRRGWISWRRVPFASRTQFGFDEDGGASAYCPLLRLFVSRAMETPHGPHPLLRPVGNSVRNRHSAERTTPTSSPRRDVRYAPSPVYQQGLLLPKILKALTIARQASAGPTWGHSALISQRPRGPV